MKTRLISLFCIVLVATALLNYGCSKPAPTQITVNAPPGRASEGLDLQAVGELVKKAHNAQELEKMLNDPSTGINNMDLDGDGKVDYLTVTEYGSGNSKGFSITDDLGNNNVQEIAQITVEKQSDQQATVQLQGNEQIYGPNQYYTSHFSLGEALLLAWLFTPHPLYFSPYHYGYYPMGFVGYAPVPMGVYRTRTQTITSTSTIRQTSSPAISRAPVSPNAGKSASNIKPTLAAPTQTQKQFQSRDTSRPTAGTGFKPSQGGRSTPSTGSTSRPSSPSMSSRPSSAPRSSTPSRSFGRSRR
jgi:hypothetical protein